MQADVWKGIRPRKMIKPMSLPLLALAGVVALAGAKDPQPSAKTQAEPKYDPASVVHLLGVVERTTEAKTAPLVGEWITLKTEKGAAVEVYLAPAEFLKSFEFVFEKGDQVQVSGSKVKLNVSEIVLAREIRKGGVSLVLREKNGAPIWEQWKSR